MSVGLELSGVAFFCCESEAKRTDLSLMFHVKALPVNSALTTLMNAFPKSSVMLNNLSALFASKLFNACFSEAVKPYDLELESMFFIK